MYGRTVRPCTEAKKNDRQTQTNRQTNTQETLGVPHLKELKFPSDLFTLMVFRWQNLLLNL
jgi:hypothetical protein